MDVVVGSGYAVWWRWLVVVVGGGSCVMEVVGVGDGLMASNDGGGWCWRWADG